MSTVSTQLNWGTSYVVNDWYKRFVEPTASDARLVAVARLVTLVILFLSALVTFALDSVRQAWEIMLESGAGIGLVLIMRWYWWRVTAVSEIAAIASSIIAFVVIRTMTNITFPETLFYIVPFTTICWVCLTLLVPPEPFNRLVAFYNKVRPAGPGWGPIVAHRKFTQNQSIFPLICRWALGVTSVYAMLTGVYLMIFVGPLFGFISILLSLGCMLIVLRWPWKDFGHENQHDAA